MKSFRYILVTMTLMGAGCAGVATPYKPLGLAGGFSERQEREGVFEVGFYANGLSTHERANDFLFLRFAEITTAHGYKYFVVLESENAVPARSYATPENSHTTAQASGHVYGTAHPTTYGEEPINSFKSWASSVIQCYKDLPLGEELVFDAAVVARSIREKYELAQGSN